MKRTSLLFALLGAALVLVSLWSLCTGSAALSPEEFLNGLYRREGYETASLILYHLRLPRLWAGLVAGAGLSLSGFLLQTVMANPLASPNTVGVNAGAGLGMILCLSFFPSQALAAPAAFLGALCALLLILALSKRAGEHHATVVLAGIACTSLFQALISFFSLLDTDVLSDYAAFSVGGFQALQTDSLFWGTIPVLLSLLLSLVFASPIGTLALGEEVSLSLGVRVKAIRVLAILLAGLSAAAVVSFAGLLGFVGLVVPHLARKLCPNGSQRQLMTATVMTGSLLVTLSDLAGRTLFAPAEISVGIVTAFFGAPFFLILLLQRRGGNASL